MKLTKYQKALQDQFIADITRDAINYYGFAPEVIVDGSSKVDTIQMVKDSMWTIRKEHCCQATVKVSFKVGDDDILCGGFFEEVTSSAQGVDKKTGIIKTNYDVVAAKIEAACDLLKETLLHRLASKEKHNLEVLYKSKA